MNAEDIKCCLTYPGYLSENEKFRAAGIFDDHLRIYEDFGDIEHVLVEAAVKADFDPKLISLSNHKFVISNGKWIIMHDGIISKVSCNCSKTFSRLLGLSAKYMLKKSIHKDSAFKAIANGVLDAPSVDPICSPKYSLARREDGALIGLKDFKGWLKNKILIKCLLESTVNAGDLEGLRHLLSFKNSTLVALDISKDISWRRVDPLNPCLSIFKPESAVMDFAKYCNNIVAMARGSNVDVVRAISCSDYNKTGGHEIILALGIVSTDEAEELCRIIVQDGGDWYLGHKLFKFGHESYIDYADRIKNPVAELADMLDSIDLKKISRIPRHVYGIVRGIDYEIKVSVAMKENAYAEKLYAIEPNNGYIKFMSKLAKAKALTNDLEI